MVRREGQRKEKPGLGWWQQGKDRKVLCSEQALAN